MRLAEKLCRCLLIFSWSASDMHLSRLSPECGFNCNTYVFAAGPGNNMFRVQFSSSEVMPEEVNVSFSDVKGVSAGSNYLYYRVFNVTWDTFV